ncbi:MAG: hypothetical protein EP343_07035 [Deltaproteobacteria bacterium]|nr:MAG: hypothetical protein EP343_07035 [Deltaproteobacteria bacterium]
MRSLALCFLLGGLLYSSASWAGYCTYNHWKDPDRLCVCKHGIYKSSAKGVYKLGFLKGKAWVRKQLRKKAKNTCLQVYGRIRSYRDKINSWKTFVSKGKKYGRMTLETFCYWRHVRRSKTSKGPWTERLTITKTITRKFPAGTSKSVARYHSSKAHSQKALKTWFRLHIEKQRPKRSVWQLKNFSVKVLSFRYVNNMATLSFQAWVDHTFHLKRRVYRCYKK